MVKMSFIDDENMVLKIDQKRPQNDPLKIDLKMAKI
jgi:hypothetical protein